MKPCIVDILRFIRVFLLLFVKTYCPQNYAYLIYYVQNNGCNLKVSTAELVHLINETSSFVRLFLCSFDRSIVRSFDRSIVRSFDRSIVRSFDRSIVRSFDRSIVRSFDRSFIRCQLL